MILKPILDALNSQPPIGGLEINDTGLKFALIKGNDLKTFSFKFGPGVMEEGRIKNRDGLKSALFGLHSQITSRSKKKIFIVLNIPDRHIFIQGFNLPIIATGNIEEAAKLNLQMISPIDFNTAYYDWQKIGETNFAGGQIENLGAFVPAQIVDEFVFPLKESNFEVVAVESPSLSLTRAIESKDQNNILLQVDTAGLNFGIIRNNNLYFNHFVNWPTAEEKQISWSVLKDFIIRESQKIFNFFTNHWPGQVNNLLLMIPSPALEEKVSQVVKENFPFNAGSVKNFISERMRPFQAAQLTPDWFPVLGSTLRGLIPRSKDNFISLAASGTEEDFRRHQIINFFGMWRNVVLTIIIFMFITFAVGDFFLFKNVKFLKDQLKNYNTSPEIERLDFLQKQAGEFNQKVNFALTAKAQIINWVPFIEKIKELTISNNIVIEKIAVQSLETPVSFRGVALNEEAVINFKKILEAQPQFSDINLPISNITPTTVGKLNFVVSFKIKNLNF